MRACFPEPESLSSHGALSGPHLDSPVRHRNQRAPPLNETRLGSGAAQMLIHTYSAMVSLDRNLLFDRGAGSSEESREPGPGRFYVLLILSQTGSEPNLSRQWATAQVVPVR